MPYRPHVHGLKFAIRVSHLEASDVLRVRCPSCGHLFSVAPHELLARFPAFMPIIDLERSMRCKKCPHKGPMGWHIERAFPPVQ